MDYHLAYAQADYNFLLLFVLLSFFLAIDAVPFRNPFFEKGRVKLLKHHYLEVQAHTQLSVSSDQTPHHLYFVTVQLAKPKEFT